MKRLISRLRGPSLDRDLASGTPPERSGAHALRARALLEPTTRYNLARQLRRVVGIAIAPPRPTSLVPIARRDVSEAETELRRLASRLQAPTPVEVRGVARVRLLITDGCGPLYHRDSPRRLGDAVREATDALD